MMGIVSTVKFQQMSENLDCILLAVDEEGNLNLTSMVAALLITQTMSIFTNPNLLHSKP